MRIGIDATPLLHGERAVRRNSRNLLTALVQHQEIDWRLLYFDRKGNTPGRLGPEIAVQEVVCRWPVRLLLPAWRHLSRPALESFLGDIDLFYAPDLYFPPSEKTKILTTIRGVAYFAIPEHCAPGHVESLSKAFAYARKNANYFLAVSESTRQDILRYTDIPEDRIYVSSHGVDPAFHPIKRTDAQGYVARYYGVDRPYFLYVGVVAAHKNVSLLIDAMLAASAMQETDLVLAGPWQEPFTSQLRCRLERAGLTKRVHMTGPVGQGNDALPNLYSAAVALVFPTLYEGWCAPPLEAMASGTPVIASDIAPVREVAGEAGILLPTDDPGAWGMAMEKVAGDEQWHDKLSIAGLTHVKQHTWERSANRLIDVFNEIAGRDA